LIKFNKFLQENESKRNRAVKRAGDERRQREVKEVEIARLKRQYQEKMEEELQMKAYVAQNIKYQQYLTDVVEHVQGSEDFPEVQDLLNRYKTLRDANNDLTKRQVQHDIENENKRQQFSQFTKERANEVLNQNNAIATLQKNLESCTIKTLEMQSDVDTGIRNMSDKVLQLGQMLASIDNLLERFETHASKVKRKKDGSKKASTAEELEREGKRAQDNLEAIATYMIDYNSIVGEWKAKAAADEN